MRTGRRERIQNNISAPSDLAARHRRSPPPRPVRRAGSEAGPHLRRSAAKRKRQATTAIISGAWRFGRAAAAFVLAVAIVAGIGFAYREFAASRYFKLRHVELSGDLRAPREELISSLYQHTEGGLWQTDLDNLRQKLRAHPWVRDAEVVRVLPDTLRVRISEREPFAQARLSNGSLVWVDRDGVILDEQGAFKGGAEVDKGLPLLSGLVESREQERVEANKQILLLYQRLVDELRQGDPPLLERIDEVHFTELGDVEMHLAGRGVKVIAGGEDFHGQVKRALAVLDAVARRDLSTLELFRVTDAERLLGGRRISYINTKSTRRLVIGLAQ